MPARRNNREGFSLIEMIIAIAIISIVMSGVILLISYSTNSMRRTNNMVNLQNETKDALLHITTYLQEASDASWVPDKKALIVVKKKCDPDGSVAVLDVSHYWLADADSVDDKKSIVFIQDVVDFDCRVRDKVYEIGADGKPVSEGAVDILADGDSDSVICFCKKEYKKDEVDLANFFLADGSIDYSKLSIDYSTVSIGPDGEASFSEGEPAPAGPSVPTGGSVDLDFDPPAPTPQPTRFDVGGKSVVVTLKLKNYNGDAEFVGSKEVFLRNQ